MITILKVPYRSPLKLIEEIKFEIEGKIVCEIGAAAGDILVEMSKYAKEVIGIEFNQNLSHLQQRRFYCPSTIINGTFPSCKGDIINTPDMFYFWINRTQNSIVCRQVIELYPNAQIIISGDMGYADGVEEKNLHPLVEEFGGEMRQFGYEEEGQRGTTWGYYIKNIK